MAITVTFSGNVDELISLFQSNGFLDAVRAQVGNSVKVEAVEEAPASSSVQEKPEEAPAPVKAKEEPEKPKISRQQMLHAVQEYAVRMYNRYKEFYPDLNVKDMCAQLMLEQTAGTANHTSMVGDMFIEQVYHYAVNDYIPSAYDYLK